MKIKFTEEDMEAIETAYFENEGYLPCLTTHLSKEAAYRQLQQLWLRMARRVEREEECYED